MNAILFLFGHPDKKAEETTTKNCDNLNFEIENETDLHNARFAAFQTSS